MSDETVAVDHIAQEGSDDVRRDRDFDAALFPLADGLRPPPVGTTDPVSQIKITFLSAYYRANLAYRRVEENAAGREGLSDSDRRHWIERLRLALQHRDTLDQTFWRKGIRAEPVFEDGLVVDIRFVSPPKQSDGGQVLRSIEVGLS